MEMENPGLCVNLLRACFSFFHDVLAYMLQAKPFWTYASVFCMLVKCL
jgi:hypothetical protein